LDEKRDKLEVVDRVDLMDSMDFMDTMDKHEEGRVFDGIGRVYGGQSV